jgi:mannitol/fructose-specific phosphotransferase system IIA component (Ntr-type)
MALAGTLPGVKVGIEWRFEKAAIDAWLAERAGHDGEADFHDIPDGVQVPLSDLLEEKSVTEIRTADGNGAIEALAARALESGWVSDKAWLVQAVAAREQLASTATDGGVAFLHTRERNASRIMRPFIVFGRSHGGIDFAAPDGKPTHLFFLLGLKYDRLHLPVLGRLARVLRRPEIVRTLRAAPSVARLRDTLLQEDHRLLLAEADRRKKRKA